MEKREEIKDGVKQRLIEFMAEQITKEESFVDLKNELIQELLTKKTIKRPIIDEAVESLFDKFKQVASEKNKKFEFNREEFTKRINDIKTGKEDLDLKTFITDTGNYSDTHKDILKLLEDKGAQEFYTVDNFDEPKLKYTFSKFNTEKFKEINLESIQKHSDNYIPNSELCGFEIKEFINGENLYKTYELFNKLEKFKFSCSFVYNKEKEEKYIDKLLVDSAGLLLANEDLGIPFAIKAMEIMEKAKISIDLKNLESLNTVINIKTKRQRKKK